MAILTVWIVKALSFGLILRAVLVRSVIDLSLFKGDLGFKLIINKKM